MFPTVSTFNFIFAIKWLFWLRLCENTLPAKTYCDVFPTANLMFFQ